MAANGSSQSDADALAARLLGAPETCPNCNNGFKADWRRYSGQCVICRPCGYVWCRPIASDTTKRRYDPHHGRA